MICTVWNIKSVLGISKSTEIIIISEFNIVLNGTLCFYRWHSANILESKLIFENNRQLGRLVAVISSTKRIITNIYIDCTSRILFVTRLVVVVVVIETAYRTILRLLQKMRRLNNKRKRSVAWRLTNNESWRNIAET